MSETSLQRLSASFRDSSGFVYFKNKKLLRQINQSAKTDYDNLHSSGLYKVLTDKNLLISHQEIGLDNRYDDKAVVVIQPDFIPFISYPYEWSFSQLKDAALITLQIQKLALDHNMSLKDASSFNIQFLGSQPVFVDTLSFEKYKFNSPWIAYRQFCQHFLAPLALMSFNDIRLQKLLRTYIDGVPLDLVSKLLPTKSRLKPGLVAHIHMHAHMQQRHAKDYSARTTTKSKISKQQLKILLDHLTEVINNLIWQPRGTEWAEYYNETNYSDIAFTAKHKFIKKSFNYISPQPKIIWDLGANNGEFSRFATTTGTLSVAMDIDPAAVEQNYRLCQTEKNKYMLPLLMDLTNPSPSLGWQETERNSLLQRGPVDLVLALALVHHLSLSNNVPFYSLAEFFAQAGEYLVVEFIPQSDSQVQKLIHRREDDLIWYNQENFEIEFTKIFTIINQQSIPDSDRVIYFMKKINV